MTVLLLFLIFIVLSSVVLNIYHTFWIIPSCKSSNNELLKENSRIANDLETLSQIFAKEEAKIKTLNKEIDDCNITNAELSTMVDSDTNWIAHLNRIIAHQQETIKTLVNKYEHLIIQEEEFVD